MEKVRPLPHLVVAQILIKINSYLACFITFDQELLYIQSVLKTLNMNYQHEVDKVN